MRADASELADLVRDLGGISAVMEGALSDTLRDIATESQQAISGSTERPYLTGHLRTSFEISQDGMHDWVVSSPVPYSRIWEHGGASGAGHRVQIPRTEYASRQIREIGDDADSRMITKLELAVRERGFS